ncbi:class I adenylate-forming enzyme family protein [Pseudonocardia xishanensis]|uniref:Acyl-CoA synthetase n=1 Tax=Pseudonocardia xishanensis TaxID=630995 RepID=A0ABP8RYQ1_9PSEU
MSYLNCGRLLRLAADRNGPRPFLTFGARTWTYAQFHQTVNRLANSLLASGVKSGDRVAILSHNSDGVLLVLFAAARIGAVTVPLNTMLTNDEAVDLVVRSKASVLAVGSGLSGRLDGILERVPRPRLVLQLGEGRPESPDVVSLDELIAASIASDEPHIAVADEDLATIIFTSGSTGTPKATAKTHANLGWSAVNLQLAEPRDRRSVELFAIPLSGIGFANFILADVLAGAHVVLMAKFDADEAVRLIEHHRVTHAFLAPTMLLSMAGSPELRDGALRSVVAVDTAYEMSPEQRRSVAECFPAADFVYGYGSTEGLLNRTPPDRFLTDPTCVGRPAGLDETRVMTADGRLAATDEVGEIELYGPTRMAGYLGQDDAEVFTGDGWYRTGDLGSMDEDGMLHFRGRIKDMIKSGGYNVAAAEVESAIGEVDGVRAVAVVGRSHPYWGEAVVAAVVLETEAEADKTRRAITDHLSQRLSAYKRPKHVEMVTDLPYSPSGKVAKGVLVAALAHVFADEGARSDGG